MKDHKLREILSHKSKPPKWWIIMITLLLIILVLEVIYFAVRITAGDIQSANDVLDRSIGIVGIIIGLIGTFNGIRK